MESKNFLVLYSILIFLNLLQSYRFLEYKNKIIFIVLDNFSLLYAFEY